MNEARPGEQVKTVLNDLSEYKESEWVYFKGVRLADSKDVFSARMLVDIIK